MLFGNGFVCVCVCVCVCVHTSTHTGDQPYTFSLHHPSGCDCANFNLPTISSLANMDAPPH